MPSCVFEIIDEIQPLCCALFEPNWTWLVVKTCHSKIAAVIELRQHPSPTNFHTEQRRLQWFQVVCYTCPCCFVLECVLYTLKFKLEKHCCEFWFYHGTACFVRLSSSTMKGWKCTVGAAPSLGNWACRFNWHCSSDRIMIWLFDSRSVSSTRIWRSDAMRDTWLKEMAVNCNISDTETRLCIDLLSVYITDWQHPLEIPDWRRWNAEVVRKIVVSLGSQWPSFRNALLHRKVTSEVVLLDSSCLDLTSRVPEN